MFRQAWRETIGDDVLERATQRGRRENQRTLATRAERWRARGSQALVSGAGRATTSGCLLHRGSRRRSGNHHRIANYLPLARQTA